jgi:hypothetical protein
MNQRMMKTVVEHSIYRVYKKVDNFETALNFTNPVHFMKFYKYCLGTYNVE